MAKSTIENQIQARVEEFAAELSTLVRQAALEAVGEAIRGGVSASLGRAAGRPARKTKATGRKSVSRTATGRRRRRTAEELVEMQSDLVAYVTKNSGQRLEQIAVGMNIDSHDLKRPIQMLLEEKMLTKQGQRRGTSYFAKGAAKPKPAKKATKKATRKKAARK